MSKSAPDNSAAQVAEKSTFEEPVILGETAEVAPEKPKEEIPEANPNIYYRTKCLYKDKLNEQLMSKYRPQLSPDGRFFTFVLKDRMLIINNDEIRRLEIEQVEIIPESPKAEVKQ